MYTAEGLPATGGGLLLFLGISQGNLIVLALAVSLLAVAVFWHLRLRRKQAKLGLGN